MPQSIQVFALILIALFVFAMAIGYKPKKKEKQVYESTTWTPVAQSEPKQETKPTPAGAGLQSYHTMTVGVVIPIAQAFITALVLGFAAFVIALIFKASLALAGEIFAGVFALALTVVWLSRQSGWTRAVRWMEYRYGLDLDGDGYVGEPEQKEPERITVNMDYRGGQERHTRTYTANQKQLEQLAVGILYRGKPFSETAWTGAGKPFSQNGLRTLRSEFERDGLVVQVGKGENAPYEFTDAGREVLRAFVSAQAQAVEKDGFTPIPH